MLHELLHVERRDNLAVVLQKAMLTLLWFYPLAWLIDRKLSQERERACDEEVLRLRQSPETYVSGILKVVRACVSSGWLERLPLAVQVSRDGWPHLLSTGPPSKLGIRERALVIGFVAGLAVFSLGSGLVSRDAYAARSAAAGRYSLRTQTGQQGIQKM